MTAAPTPCEVEASALHPAFVFSLCGWHKSFTPPSHESHLPGSFQACWVLRNRNSPFEYWHCKPSSALCTAVPCTAQLVLVYVLPNMGFVAQVKMEEASYLLIYWFLHAFLWVIYLLWNNKMWCNFCSKLPKATLVWAMWCFSINSGFAKINCLLDYLRLAAFQQECWKTF